MFKSAKSPRLLRASELKILKSGDMKSWWTAIRVRLLLQRREGLKISYWFLFHTDRSTLPYRLGFPIIAANAVEAALKQASLSEVAAAPTGVLPPISLQPDREYRGQKSRWRRVTFRSSTTGVLTGVPAAHAGRYDVFDGSDLTTSIGTGTSEPSGKFSSGRR
jgi:hypothetical protein